MRNKKIASIIMVMIIESSNKYDNQDDNQDDNDN